MSEHGFETDFEERATETPERALWRFVVVTTIREARMFSDKNNIQQSAASWLLAGSDDAVYVCDLAGMDYQFVRDRAAYLIVMLATLTAAGRWCDWSTPKRRVVWKPASKRQVKGALEFLATPLGQTLAEAVKPYMPGTIEGCMDEMGKAMAISRDVDYREAA